MLSLLPDYVDPVRLCGLGKVYEGTIGLSEMPRLVELLTDASGDAQFRLDFGRDAEQRSVVGVVVETGLRLTCQRCLGAMEHRVATSSRLAVVQGPVEAERLPGDLDPLLVTGERIALRALLEDELILSIPNAPMHPPDECEVDLRRLNSGSARPPTGLQAQTESPFAALAGLKRKRNRND